MKKHWLLLSLALLCFTTLNARPIDVERAKAVAGKFSRTQLQTRSESVDLQLVYTGVSDRNETCFYVFNVGEQGFVIVSADDRFRPIVGYSNEGTFATENRSPELDYYLGRIIAARTSRNVVLFDDTAEEWQSVMTTGRLLSRNGGKGVDILCSTKWNQDAPYNLYAPEASGGPGNRCYAGCVATAMSQVMKYWDHPMQGTSSHSYYCYGYGRLEANFGATVYDWDNMPDRLSGNSSDEEVDAVATLMYHCAVAVDMMFSPNGSGAYSWDVPVAIRKYFSYSNQAKLNDRESYTLAVWQNMLKESFDKGWPVYYSGFSESGGHAFVCDGYDDNDLFHFNWGWGGSSDGWFVIDEIDYADGAGAVFNFVPTNVYLYMPMQPENFEVIPSGSTDYAATINWTNPTQNIHFETLSNIDQIVVTRDGEVIYTEDNVTPGADMSFTDHYMPTEVTYAVYAMVEGVKGLKAVEQNVLLGPNCMWHLETGSADGQGWKGSYLSLINAAGIEIGQFTNSGEKQSANVVMPVGHVDLYWNSSSQGVEQMSFELTDADGNTVVAFEGASSDLHKGLFFIINNTCGNTANSNVPQNLNARRDGEVVVLQWDAVEAEINHYCVYRDGVMYALSATNAFSDEAADAFHTYYVTSITEDGESEPSNVCNVMNNGECNAPSGLRYEMVNKKVKLTWDAPEGDAPTGYFVYRRTPGEEFKRIKATANPSYTDNSGSLPADFYEYAVAAYYQASDCTSAYASSLDDPEQYYVTVNRTIIPKHLEAEVVGDNVELHWEAALLAETYNVYRDNALIAQGLIELTFTDEGVSSSEAHSYVVTGLTEFIESNPSNEVVVYYGATVVETNDNESIVVYPNPTSGELQLDVMGLSQVSVFNLMGQEVMRQAANGDHLVLDLSNLPEGSYFIKVVAESGSFTKKIVKAK